MIKYVTKQQFDELLAKGARTFPNGRMLELDGKEYYNCEGIECSIYLIRPEHYKWYIGMSFGNYAQALVAATGDKQVDTRVVCLKVNDFFPTELIAGTRGKKYDASTALSQKTGWLKATGNRGSGSEFFRADKVQEAIKILQANGYNFIWPEKLEYEHF